MQATLSRLASQQDIDPRTNVTIVLVMEQAESHFEAKAARLRAVFSPCFKDVLVTAHPSGLGNERPGKSSNMVWAWHALHTAVETAAAAAAPAGIPPPVAEEPSGDDETVPLFQDEPGLGMTKVKPSPRLLGVGAHGLSLNPDRTVVTLMDADALCHPKFLATLSRQFEAHPNDSRHTRFWQCPIFFYENIGELDFVNRSCSVIFGFNELSNSGGFIDLGLMGYHPRVPVNTYSLSWRLWSAIHGGDPAVVADESDNLFLAHYASSGRAQVEPIHLPISVYAPTSDEFLTGFLNRFRQIKRWMYGNASEYGIWAARYFDCRLYGSSRPTGTELSVLDVAPVLWRLFMYSSVNLVQPIFFCFYGLSWLFYLRTPYFQSLATGSVTVIMTAFTAINVAMFIIHWRLVSELKVTALQDWPLWKKVVVTAVDAILGVGASTVFYVLLAGLAANLELALGGGLHWSTEGRTQHDSGASPPPTIPRRKEEPLHADLRAGLGKSRSTYTLRTASARVASEPSTRQGHDRARAAVQLPGTQANVA